MSDTPVQSTRSEKIKSTDSDAANKNNHQECFAPNNSANKPVIYLYFFLFFASFFLSSSYHWCTILIFPYISVLTKWFRIKCGIESFGFFLLTFLPSLDKRLQLCDARYNAGWSHQSTREILGRPNLRKNQIKWWNVMMKFSILTKM